MTDIEPLLRAAGEVTRLQGVISDNRQTIRECQKDIADAKPRLANAIVELQELAGVVAVKALAAAPEDTCDPDGEPGDVRTAPRSKLTRRAPGRDVTANELPRFINGHMTVYQYMTQNGLFEGDPRGKAGATAIAVGRAWSRENPDRKPKMIYTSNRTKAAVYPIAWLTDYFTRPNTR